MTDFWIGVIAGGGWGTFVGALLGIAFILRILNETPGSGHGK